MTRISRRWLYQSRILWCAGFQGLSLILYPEPDIDVMLGNGYNSSLTDEVIKDPNFPKPYKLSLKGKRRWKRTEVVEFFDQRFKEAAC